MQSKSQSISQGDGKIAVPAIQQWAETRIHKRDHNTGQRLEQQGKRGDELKVSTLFIDYEMNSKERLRFFWQFSIGHQLFRPQ